MRTKFQRLLGFWLFDDLGFSILCRLVAVTLIGLWAYQAFVLGWTDSLVGSVQGGSAWAQRDHYAARGLDSLHHSSVLNLAKSMMFLPLLLVVTYALAWPRRVYEAGLAARCLFFGALLLLMIYSFIASDIPFNFYGSRYYLPMAIPASMLAFGVVVATWPRVLGMGAALLVIAGSWYYVWGLESVPAYQGSIRFQSDLAREARGSDVIFLLGQRGLARDNQVSLMGISGLPVIFIDTEVGGEKPRKLIDDYMSAMGAEQATIISTRRLPYASAQKRVELKSSSIPFQIRYNTYERHLEAQRLYVGQYVDDTLALMNPRPQWVVGGTLSLPLSRPGNADDLVIVQTGNGWQWAHAKAGTPPVLELTVDGEPATLQRVEGATFVFALPSGTSGSESLVLRSSTFVPAEVGINSDRRELGVDVVSIRFGRSADPSPVAIP